jgi:hypothetical protein
LTSLRGSQASSFVYAGKNIIGKIKQAAVKGKHLNQFFGIKPAYQPFFANIEKLGI